MELFSCSDVLRGAELLSRLPGDSGNTKCYRSLGTLWTWKRVLASAGGLRPTPVPPQGIRLPPGTARGGGISYS